MTESHPKLKALKVQNNSIDETKVKGERTRFLGQMEVLHQTAVPISTLQKLLNLQRQNDSQNKKPQTTFSPQFITHQQRLEKLRKPSIPPHHATKLHNLRNNYKQSA
jgi:hypothetical protein